MADAIDAALAAAFRDPSLSRPATYHPSGGADITGIRAIWRQPDEVFEGAGVGVTQHQRLVDVRVVDVAGAGEDDEITVDGTRLHVRRAYHPDRMRRIWRLELVEA